MIAAKNVKIFQKIEFRQQADFLGLNHHQQLSNVISRDF